MSVDPRVEAALAAYVENQRMLGVYSWPEDFSPKYADDSDEGSFMRAAMIAALAAADAAILEENRGKTDIVSKLRFIAHNTRSVLFSQRATLNAAANEIERLTLKSNREDAPEPINVASYNDYDDIIDRLYTTKGPNRVLDARIWCLIGNIQFLAWNVGKEGKSLFCIDEAQANPRREVATIEIPEFTASLDAIKQLILNVLPGWAWGVASCYVSDDAWLSPDFNDPVHGARLLAEFPQEEARRDPLEFLGTDIDLRPPGREAIALYIALVTALKARSVK